MTTEQAFLERSHRREPRREPLPLFSLAEQWAIWSHQFGLPATDREHREAVAAGLIQPAEVPAAALILS